MNSAAANTALTVAAAWVAAALAAAGDAAGANPVAGSAAGDRVAIHAEEEHEKLFAETVEVGAAPAEAQHPSAE